MEIIKKSPIKDKPLRSPGQSLEEERFNLVFDKLLFPVLLALFFVILAGLEWLRYYQGIPPQPIHYTLFAIIVVGFAAWRYWRLMPKAKAIKQGIEGEKAVGQFLDRLRERGYHVFHDLIGTGFNVDHVVIGPAGIFTIETKTWSKPARGEARIRFDGTQLTVAGRDPERNTIVQARAQVSWLKGLLLESTGKPFEVFPVVVFPGWFIDSTEGSLRSIWVLEPKALPKFLDNSQVRLTQEDVSLASYHLARFIRSSEREREK